MENIKSGIIAFLSCVCFILLLSVFELNNNIAILENAYESCNDDFMRYSKIVNKQMDELEKLID